MWNCPKCGEKLEDQFDSCWKCQYARTGPIDRNKAEAPPQQTLTQSGEYEFNKEQNETIESLASNMGLFSAIIFIFGLLQCLGGLLEGFNGVGNVLTGLFCVIVGWLTHIASKAFSRIIKTEGDDLLHLMKGLKSLDQMYRLQLYLILGAFGFGLLMPFLISLLR